MPTSVALLELENFSVRYGHVQAVTGVSLRVGQGEVVAVLGANGAGKSSLLRAISGVAPSTGTAMLNGRRIDHLASHKIARAGLAHVPEGRRVIAPLSVKDNLVMAALAWKRCPKRQVGETLDEVFRMFPRLLERENQTSGLLSGGEQQMLAIGRGLMAKPDLLMLDEPSMGLAPIVIDEIYEFLRDRRGLLATVGILLAEQTAALALSVAQRAYVLAQGQVSFEGAASDVDESRMVAAYLGG